MRGHALVGAILAAALLSPGSAGAVFSGAMSPRPPASDADYARTMVAREAKDWVAMLNHLLRVVERRPWHDNAHNLLGYGYRKMSYARNWVTRPDQAARGSVSRAATPSVNVTPSMT